MINPGNKGTSRSRINIRCRKICRLSPMLFNKSDSVPRLLYLYRNFSVAVFCFIISYHYASWHKLYDCMGIFLRATRRWESGERVAIGRPAWYSAHNAGYDSISDVVWAQLRPTGSWSGWCSRSELRAKRNCVPIGTRVNVIVFDGGIACPIGIMRKRTVSDKNAVCIQPR